MNPPPRFSAIIFDCDGVLVDSEVIAIEIELAALAEVGVSYALEEYKARFMGTSAEAFHAALEADFLTLTGRNLPADFREKCRARWRAAAHRLAEVPGARAAVSEVPHMKAVASSSTAEALAEKLRKTALWEIFDPHIYSANHVIHPKPAPDLFLYAADALGVEPARCLVLEDSVNGIMAARAAGMTVWGFLGGGHMDEATGHRLASAGAELLVNNWVEAGELLAALG